MLRSVQILDDDVDGLDVPSCDQGDATGVRILAADDLVEERAVRVKSQKDKVIE